MALACSYLHLNSWDWGLLRPKDTPLSEGPCRTRDHPQRRSPSRKVSWRGYLLRVFNTCSSFGESGGHAPKD